MEFKEISFSPSTKAGLLKKKKNKPTLFACLEPTWAGLVSPSQNLYLSLYFANSGYKLWSAGGMIHTSLPYESSLSLWYTMYCLIYPQRWVRQKLRLKITQGTVVLIETCLGELVLIIPTFLCLPGLVSFLHICVTLGLHNSLPDLSPTPHFVLF